jgi:hypothetical protein
VGAVTSIKAMHNMWRCCETQGYYSYLKHGTCSSRVKNRLRQTQLPFPCLFMVSYELIGVYTIIKHTLFCHCNRVWPYLLLSDREIYRVGLTTDACMGELVEGNFQSLIINPAFLTIGQKMRKIAASIQMIFESQVGMNNKAVMYCDCDT